MLVPGDGPWRCAARAGTPVVLLALPSRLRARRRGSPSGLARSLRQGLRCGIFEDAFCDVLGRIRTTTALGLDLYCQPGAFLHTPCYIVSLAKPHHYTISVATGIIRRKHEGGPALPHSPPWRWTSSLGTLRASGAFRRTTDRCGTTLVKNGGDTRRAAHHRQDWPPGPCGAIASRLDSDTSIAGNCDETPVDSEYYSRDSRGLIPVGLEQPVDPVRIDTLRE